jgi:hypothetical protein
MPEINNALLKLWFSMISVYKSEQQRTEQRKGRRSIESYFYTPNPFAGSVL